MVEDDRPSDWRDLWGYPKLGDWDMDDMEALIRADDWETFVEDMDKAYTEYLLSGGEAGSIPEWLLDRINDFLKWHGLRPQPWWAELYGR